MIANFSDTATQTAQFTHPNSGYAPTKAGPTTNTFTVSVTSGNCYLSQIQLTSGAVQTVNLVSGGLTDLVGDTINSTKLFNIQFLGLSGGVQVETYQSGGARIAGFSTQSGYPASGYGQLLTPGDSLKFGQSASGSWQSLSPGNGSVNFRAVSGAGMFQVGFYGV